MPLKSVDRQARRRRRGRSVSVESHTFLEVDDERVLVEVGVGRVVHVRVRVRVRVRRVHAHVRHAAHQAPQRQLAAARRRQRVQDRRVQHYLALLLPEERHGRGRGHAHAERRRRRLRALRRAGHGLPGDGLLRDRLAGRDAVSASVRVLVHERAVLLAAAARLVLPIARDLLAVFPELHMAEFAPFVHAFPLLPGRAHGLAAQG